MAVSAPDAHARREAALLKACRLDVVAFKPGNVSLCSPGHGMSAADFLASARIAVPWLCAERLGVGQRMQRAMEATMAAVGCNTNLGIVLLLAPLAAASERRAPLREALAAVLASLTVDDARACYAAIRTAQPAGLGSVDEGDVHAPVTRDLGAAMALAAERDSIARQYGTVFNDVFEHGVPLLRELRARWRSLAWATTACYLDHLARWPDSHVARKHDPAPAHALQASAREVAKAMKACENPRSFAVRLKAFDRELKTRGINPGTSADLTVASVAALLLLERSS